MTPIKQCFRIATMTIAMVAGQQAMAAGYLKIGDIPGESLRVAPATQPMAQGTTGGAGGAGKVHYDTFTTAGGGLDRDIIRRSSDPRQPVTTRLPAGGATQLHGVEPDEID
ncbi:hypothetical protein [Alcanivorax sp.]|uniref:hypothetical protein n=1 Tax=Alcanivorax sp. TaxID=1872427 RepID=UPI0025C33201|nr:hypothetical protein [Alcanivorax sp.]